MPNTEYINTQIQEWYRKVSDLKDKRNTVSDRSRVEYDRQLDLMTSKLEAIKENLGQYERSREDSIDELDTVMEKSLKEIDDAFNSAIAKLM